MKVKINDKELYYDGWLYNEYTVIRDKVIRRDFDWITFIDGVEGGGKSTLAQQLALLCDSTFNISRICFTHQEFVQAVTTAQPYQAVIFDEAYGAISSKDALSKVCKTITSLLAQIRQKNLFLFIVAPTFFDISRNIALWRSKCLIHVYLGQGYERGYWRAFTYKKKNQLYVLGRKLYNYGAVQQSARGRFTKQLVVDDKAYRRKKLEALEYFQEDMQTHSTIKDQRNALIRYLRRQEDMVAPKINEIFTDAGVECLTERHIMSIYKQT